MSIPLPDNPVHIEYLCSGLNLGRPRGSLARVSGGLHHRMWRLHTTSGGYAVKQLATDIDLSQPGVTARYNISEAVARQFAQRGIAAVHALYCNGNYLQLVGNEGYLVYPWVDASGVGKHQIAERHVAEAARIMATMHGARLQVAGLSEPELESHQQEKIQWLVSRAVGCNIRDADLLREYLPRLLTIASSKVRAQQALNAHMVVSHGDLDHKNILWDRGGMAHVIDWESVRWINPTHELLLEALDWAGITLTFQHELFEAFLAHYRQAGGVVWREYIVPAFDCIAGDWLNWLLYNVGRAVDTADAEQHATGSGQVDLALSTLLRLDHLMPRLESLACNG